MRAISKNTRKVTALTLAAALVVAVYLNWQYARAGVTLEENGHARFPDAPTERSRQEQTRRTKPPRPFWTA